MIGLLDGSSDSQKETGYTVGQLLFAKDLSKALDTFAYAMRDPKQFDRLAKFLHDHPKRYAFLMTEFVKERRKRNRIGVRDAYTNADRKFTSYLHQSIIDSQDFAIRSARGWRKGWGLTVEDVVPKLSVRFPSTRRVAVEFLKLENDGIDFGFDWKKNADPKKNREAILKWKEWLKLKSQK